MSEAIVQNMDIRSAVSAEEWAIRQDLAAAYRLVAHYGWDDMVFTHLSARVPGPEDHFLLNPYGFQFSEVTASNLVKVDLDGNVVLSNGYEVNAAGLPFTVPFIWRATMPRPSCTCIPTAGGRVGHARGSAAHYAARPLRLSRHGLSRLGRSRLGPGRARTCGCDLGSKHLMMLRNHGTLALGGSVGPALCGSTTSNVPQNSGGQ